jgi:hypothetical protein
VHYDGRSSFSQLVLFLILKEIASAHSNLGVLGKDVLANDTALRPTLPTPNFPEVP